MSTFMAKPCEIARKWYILDAEGKSLGRVASKAAIILRGKHKVTFTPNVDCGDHVIIINCDKAVLTGDKLNKKFYRWHTGWVGGLKEIKYSRLMKENPEKAMTLAVNGMIPDNVIGRNARRRLRTYKGSAHIHAAQKPENYNI